jgi:RNA polymerase sigma-70 factor (ECF subfamily)
MAEDRAVAFRRLAESHLDRSYRLASAILGDPVEAEDAVHDAFVQAWRKWPSLRDHALLERWFQRIVVNTCRNHLRRRARLRVRDISAELALAAPDAYATTQIRDGLDRALGQLSPDDQLLLALRFSRDLRVEDIATLLDLRPGTVMSRLHHALGRLRVVIDRIGGSEAFR